MIKKKIKIIITVIAIILIILVGLIIWSMQSGQKMSRITPSGEQREIRIPNIPGMGLLSKEKKECSYQLEYVYKFYKDKDLTSHLEKPIKDTFLGQDWILEYEIIENGFKILKFYSEKAGDFESMIVKISFEPEQGTKLFLDYQWSPCLEKKS